MGYNIVYYIVISSNQEGGVTMSSATVRISLATREKLRSLTSETGETMQAILDEAVEVYRRQLFLKRANEAFAALRNDPNAWKEEQEERVAWDITLEDDLEEE
jgi:predicted DNA-binding protein